MRRALITKEALVSRLRLRRETWALDLRGPRWGDKGELVVRDPSADGWPSAGPTTGDKAQAEAWVGDPRYIALAGGATGTTAGVTTRDACEALIAHMEAVDKRANHYRATTKGIRSVLRTHVIPKWGARPLNTLVAQDLQPWLDDLHALISRHGKAATRPASAGTRRNVRTALNRVWEHVAQAGTPTPWGALTVKDQAKREQHQARVAARAAGKVERAREKYLSRAELDTMLRGAVAFDAHAQQTGAKGRAVPVTPFLFAWLAATGARIDEALWVRWGHVTAGGIYIPGTKSAAGQRWVPTQDSLRPWLAWARERHLAWHGPDALDPQAFVVWLGRKPQAAPYETTSSLSTAAKRCIAVAQAHGIKRPNKAAHIFRSTYGTLMRQASAAEDAKTYLGHSVRYGGATDAYITQATDDDGGAPLFPAAHCRAIPLLTPQELGR